jgi:hypothetical protein
MLPMMDVYFLIDICVQFCVAHFDGAELIQRRKEIAARYLKSWFVIDFLSSFSFVIALVTSSDGPSMLRNLRIVRLMRLLKLLRVAKLKQLLAHLEELAAELHILFKLTKIFLWMCAATHLIGCGFYAVGEMTSIQDADNGVDDSSWVAAYWGPDFRDVPINIRYTVVLYWAFVTGSSRNCAAPLSVPRLLRVHVLLL